MPKLTHEICLVCGKQAVAHKLCEKHYRKMRRYGTPEPNTAYGKKYRNHPLYERWRGTGRSVVDRVQEWESFEIFLKDVREPPDLKYRLMRPNETKPYGPNNFKWVVHSIFNMKNKINPRSKYLMNPDTIKEIERVINCGEPIFESGDKSIFPMN